MIYITSDAKFDEAQKTALGEKIAAAASITLSNVGFTLIGTDATNFTIHKMGTAKDVETMMNEYGISTGIDNAKVNASATDIAEYNLAGMRSANGKGIVIRNGKKYMK